VTPAIVSVSTPIISTLIILTELPGKSQLRQARLRLMLSKAQGSNATLVVNVLGFVVIALAALSLSRLRESLSETDPAGSFLFPGKPVA